MEKPLRKNQKGRGEGRWEERGEGESHSSSGKTRCFSDKILRGVGVKTLLKKLHRFEEALSTPVGGKQTSRRQRSPLFTQTFQELGL